MVITIKEDGMRFGARAGAIIYNEDKTKILLEKYIIILIMNYQTIRATKKR